MKKQGGRKNPIHHKRNPHLRVITNNENMPDENIADVHGTKPNLTGDPDMDGSRSKLEMMIESEDPHHEQDPAEGSRDDIEKAVERGKKPEAA